MREGYHHPLYSASLSEFGTPIYLPKSNGWLIRRKIPGTSYYDAIGPYPLFFCDNWNSLTEDFDDLKDNLISISFVIAPRSMQSLNRFQSYFDIFRPYKDHYILDLSQPLNQTISKNKRRNSQRALRILDVNHTVAPNINLEKWIELYDCLIERHNIKGIRAFSRDAFSKQLKIPNTHCFWANHQGKLVGGNLYFLQNNTAYAHLSAFNRQGYEFGASYAIKWEAMTVLKDKVQWINFGGGTDIKRSHSNGLELFKKGWSSQTEQSYFCGKILNMNIYREIEQQKVGTPEEWFPAYRKDEF